MPEFYIKTLSPIHIGCDEVYEPMEFWIDQKRKDLVVFKTFDFLSKLKEQELKAFSEICKKGTISSIIELFNFLNEACSRVVTGGRKIPVATEIISKYQRMLDLPLEEESVRTGLNRFEIKRTAFVSRTEEPYLPGSAIKGALRTAYLNSVQENKELQDTFDFNCPKELEKALLDIQQREGEPDSQSDPFRFVKISDFMPVSRAKTRITLALNRKKVMAKSRKSRLPVMVEVIEPGACFSGTIDVPEPHEKAEINSPISSKALLESSTRFFDVQRKDQRLAGWAKSSVSSGNEWLLRLGRYSGAECCTIKGHRHINGIAEKHSATTHWLSSDKKYPMENEQLLPFGWALLETSPPPESIQKTTVWEKAYLSWIAGEGTLLADFQGKKARTKDKSLLPEALNKKIFEKRKIAPARVTLKELGLNHYEIIKIEAV